MCCCRYYFCRRRYQVVHTATATASALLLLSHRTLTPIPKGPHFLTFRDLVLLLFVDIFLLPWPVFFISNFSFFRPCNFHHWVCAHEQCDSLVDVALQCFWARSKRGTTSVSSVSTKHVSSFRASSAFIMQLSPSGVRITLCELTVLLMPPRSVPGLDRSVGLRRLAVCAL